METFAAMDGKQILMKMVKAIQQNKAYLGEVDGLIGDGDHGMNMNKGFSVFETRFSGETFSFGEGLNSLSMILMNEIGGSMGPIYGTIFMEMGDSLEDAGKDDIGLTEFTAAMRAGLEGLYGIVDARVGDKTLVDALSPAVDALEADAQKGTAFAKALEDMKAAATKGMESTKGLVAKFGRSSRLGERSRGVLDAGSVSCCILLNAMADGILEALNGTVHAS